MLDLVEKRLVTDQMVLTIGYDMENLFHPEISRNYKGDIIVDHYGRKVPKHAHGTVNLAGKTSSTNQIMDAVIKLYDNIVDKTLLVRRINVTANHVVDENDFYNRERGSFVQMNLFTDYETLEKQRQAEEEKREKERALQEAILSIKKKYGKNAVIKGMNLEEGATGIQRNNQIGGHRA